MSPDRAAPILGAHLSTAGGVSMALHRAIELRCNAVQLFTHSRAQWKIRPLDAMEVEQFRDLDDSWGPFALAAHSSYLVNLASPDRALRERSIRTVSTEVRHCGRLGIPLLVFHPGAHMGAGDTRGLRRVSNALNRIHRATAGTDVRTVIETTAGQSSGLGWRFEQIAVILKGLAVPDRARVCFDTAHALAAGYDFRTPRLYESLWNEFDHVLGLNNLAIFHLNDSRTALGSRVDRHAHIGKGEIGRSPFGWLLADERFKKIPKVLETPKEGDMDRKNLGLLRRLARRTLPHCGLPEG